MKSEIIRTMLTRKSIRKFKDVEVPQELLEKVLLCAVHSPTAVNSQSRRFYVLKNRTKIQQLADAMRKVLGREAYDLYQPSALVLISVPRSLENGLADTGTAMQNIMLAAHALGLGCVWINQSKDICDKPAMREALTSLNIPPDHVVRAMAAIGYPAEDPAPKERTEPVFYID